MAFTAFHSRKSGIVKLIKIGYFENATKGIQ